MDKCGMSVVGLTKMRWPGKGEIVSGNCTIFYSGGVKAENSVTVVWEMRLLNMWQGWSIIVISEDKCKVSWHCVSAIVLPNDRSWWREQRKNIRWDPWHIASRRKQSLKIFNSYEYWSSAFFLGIIFQFVKILSHADDPT